MSAGCLRGVRQRRQPYLQHRRGECRHPTMLSFDAFQTKRCPTQISSKKHRAVGGGPCANELGMAGMHRIRTLGCSSEFASRPGRTRSSSSKCGTAQFDALTVYCVYLRPLSSYVQFQKDFSMRCRTLLRLSSSSSSSSTTNHA